MAVDTPRLPNTSGFRLLTAAVLVAALTGSASGQDPAAVDPSAGIPSTWRAPRLRLDEFGFDLQVESGFDRRTVRQDGSRRWYRLNQENERVYVEETLGMRAAGTLDERILRFDTEFRFGLRQESFYEERNRVQRSEDPSGTLLEYDFNLDFLPAGRLPITVYGLQQNDRLPRPFLPTLDRMRERYGATALLDHERIPMRLSYEHEYEERLGGADRYDEERRGLDALRYEADWRIDDRQNLRINYDYEDRRERYAGLSERFDLLRQAARVEHDLRFGPKDRSNWRSFFRIEDESGRLARDTREAASRVRWQPADGLDLTLGGQFLEQRFDGIHDRRWRGDAGLVKRWEKWTATLNLYTSRSESDARGGRRGSSDLDDWGGVASLAFADENDLGDLRASVQYSFDHLDGSGGRGSGLALSESLTFRGPRINYLREQNVRRGTIVVTDANRGRIYRPILDYRVVQVGRYTAIFRNPTGLIADRETVLVHYAYRTARDYALDRQRVDWRIQQDLGADWNVYYAGSVQDEDVSRDRWIGLTPRNDNRHRVGAVRRGRRWSGGVELEYNDETIDPFRGVHANVDVALLETATGQLSGQARASHLRFDGTRDLAARESTWLDVGLSAREQLRGNLALTADAAYRFQDDGFYGRTEGYDLRAAVEYKIGQFDLLFEVEYDALQLPRSNDEAFSAHLLLKRDIPLIGSGR